MVIGPKFKVVRSFVFKEKYLTIFIFWCFLSVIWSINSLVAFKGAFVILTTCIVIMNAFLFVDYEILLKVLKIIISLYLIVTLFSVMFIPAAMDPGFNTWRGIEHQKNGLGNIGVVFFLILSLILQVETGTRKRLRTYVILGLSLLIVVMSASSTSLISLVIVLSFLLVFQIDKVFAPLRIGKFISTSVFFFQFLFIVILVYYSDELVKLVPQLFDKDLTLSGRTVMWDIIWKDTQNYLLLGCGFVSYWVLGSKQVVLLIDLYNWPLNEAHNGYLDIINQLGIIGISLLLLIIISYLFRTIKVKDTLSLVILLSILVMNVTESTLFRPRAHITFLFIFCYLLVSTKYFKNGN